ncbi:hypothetical protein PsYK624_011060 [Phanerochaete sordida]|uniref:DUF6535 domain-containing protein n=1 Tax=Phanerochaete sordida TaxID=48140 RepID=A0A9P3L810_9APHY|nr:hypothetical protein PsYK624_011060 [Phanerochaete sordida]
MATRSVSSLSETTSKRSITRDGLPKATATGSDSLPNAAAGRFGDGPRYTHDEPSSRLLGDRIDLPHDEPAGTAQNGAANGLRPHDSPTKASTEVSENLSGWAGIERHLFKHVTEEMKYYADDIDTLLVFAGLFSAFLTAFVVQTYPMLTADNSAMTNQLLALSVSSQLRTAGTIVSPTINATLAFLLDTTHFTPSAAVRAINVMFFLSLILSMASAFFGILSKQWIREHLKWNSALAEPRENVLVRQDRIEAWEAWNVAAFISSIPALLELAMMLFLAGVVTLLWTLDDVVAIIITAFAAIFIAVAAAFTILPVTLRRCPYKSPTAWACIAAYQASKPLLFRFARAVVEWAQWNLPKFTPLGYTHLAGIRSWVNRSYSIVRSWRDRDLQSCREARCRVAGKSVPRDEVHHAACRELKLLTGFSSLQLDELAENTLDDIAESALLTRALTWVKQSSQDPRIRAYTAEAAASVHRMMWDESLQHESKDRWAAKIVTNRCLLLALGTSIVRYPHSALVCLPVAAQESRRPSTVYDRSALVQHAALEIDRLAKSLPQDHAVSTPAVVTEVVCQVLVADIEHWSSRDDAQYLGKVELCTMILHLVERTWMLGDWYKDALRVMMSVDFGREEFDDIYMTVLLNTLAQDRLILDQNGKLGE